MNPEDNTENVCTTRARRLFRVSHVQPGMYDAGDPHNRICGLEEMQKYEGSTFVFTPMSDPRFYKLWIGPGAWIFHEDWLEQP